MSCDTCQCNNCDGDKCCYCGSCEVEVVTAVIKNTWWTDAKQVHVKQSYMTPHTNWDRFGTIQSQWGEET